MPDAVDSGGGGDVGTVVSAVDGREEGNDVSDGSVSDETVEPTDSLEGTVSEVGGVVLVTVDNGDDAGVVVDGAVVVGGGDGGTFVPIFTTLSTGSRSTTLSLNLRHDSTLSMYSTS